MSDDSAPKDFIREKIAADVKAGKHGGHVVTRFPPEPNGYLHIGHAKSICLNFGAAADFGGRCHLRMDDTNPSTEDVEYVEAIQRDVRWLGFTWGTHLYYASDYYERLYALAEGLVEKGLAYVCDLTEDEMSAQRGSISEPGTESPFRGRSAAENLELFRRMRKGEFPDGARVLRAKIDMAHPNLKLRDPPLYRIKHAHHYRTGDAWCLYPLYDYAHCLSDSFEGVTHSICTMEFESARELYDWVVQATGVAHVPKQTEFARLNLTYTVMSKRKLLQLVEGRHVEGWDDPRMPTLAGLRRRGVPPEALRAFCARIGVAKNLSVVDVALLEHTVRETLSPLAPRRLGVLKPLELVLENVPEPTNVASTETVSGALWPHDVVRDDLEPHEQVRELPLARTLLIEEDDFAVDPPAGWQRLAPGRSVRLRYAFVVRYLRHETDAAGRVTRVVAEAVRGEAEAAAPTKGLGTIHWVSKAHAVDADVRVVDRLFTTAEPGKDGDFLADLNPHSLVVAKAKLEPGLAQAKPGEHLQLERLGYFVVDEASRPGALVLNRTVPLKDSWARAHAAPEPAAAKPPSKVKDARPKDAGAPKAAKPLAPEAEALVRAHGVAEDVARALAGEARVRAPFEAAVGALASRPPSAPKVDVAALGQAALLLLGELHAHRDTEVPVTVAALVELAELRVRGVSNAAQREVLGAFFAEGAAAVARGAKGEAAAPSPRALAEARGLLAAPKTEAELTAAVDAVLAREASGLVAKFAGGNAGALGPLVGMAVKQAGAGADPKAVRALLEARLRAG